MTRTTEELRRISDQAQSAALACEDALFALEDRETRRAERRSR